MDFCKYVNSMSIKNGLKNTNVTFKIMYFVKVIALLVLCRVHDFTRYKFCRTFRDLFYWPEGPCVDMLVIFSVFIIGAFVLYDAFVFCDKCRIKINNKAENNIILFPNPRR